MTGGDRAEIVDLKDRATVFGYGPAKIALLEEAVRLADAAGDVTEGYECRHRLMDAASFGGRGDLLLIHFPWCLDQADHHPDRFDAHSLLWKYKWVCGRVPAFPELPLDQIEALLADFADRCERYGAGRRAVLQQQYRLAKHRGDRATAARLFRRFRDTPRDSLSDCRACEAQLEVSHHVFLGKPTTAVESAAPITAGRFACHVVPRNTYASLLVPLVKLGRTDEAAAAYRAGLRFFRTTHPTPWLAAEFITFLALTENLNRAVTLAGRHLPEAIECPEPGDQFSFALAVGFLADQLAETSRDAVRLRLPDRHPLSRPGGGVPVADLGRWAFGWADDIAARFDARNGTDAYRRQIDAHRRLARHTCHIGLG